MLNFVKFGRVLNGMTNFLTTAYSPDMFRQQGHALVDLLADHLTLAQSGESNTLKYVEPDQMLTHWQADFAQTTPADPVALWADVLRHSIHLHNPRFMGHQVSAPLPIAALTSVLTSVLNNGQAVYEMGMTGNALERIVTDWMAAKLGYSPESGGLLTSGGTLANLTALLTARALITGTPDRPVDVWQEGTTDRLAIMVSEEAHYCVDRAARIMGLGSAGIIKIPTNDRFQMRTDRLEAAFEQARADGLTIFAVVGSACSTSTGSYDDLAALADFCERHSLWFHADGAHGGAAALSDTYRPLLQGIERADSVVVDFHKMMMIPALVTGVFYKRDADAFRTFQQKAQYLWSDASAKDWFNSGKRAFECTKLMMSAKVYTVLRTYGEELIVQHVEQLYDLARDFAQYVQRQPGFELAVEPESNIVCFRYIGDETDPTQLNALNTAIRQQMLIDGRFYIVQTNLRGQVWLRVSIMNSLTTPEHLREMLNTVREFGLAVYI